MHERVDVGGSLPTILLPGERSRLPAFRVLYIYYLGITNHQDRHFVTVAPCLLVSGLMTIFLLGAVHVPIFRLPSATLFLHPNLMEVPGTALPDRIWMWKPCLVNRLNDSDMHGTSGRHEKCLLKLSPTQANKATKFQMAMRGKARHSNVRDEQNVRK
ncbi:hypothetical protein E1B28_007997 [Marasmius oreades]|uniref:Uncharacterized protein n=1 Tax=Marasmius oreades TaxID=181124 RepID=A0A9P7UU18_9AGAR|nr:uncharacterized protein E1B28_007997 [Marasmius oreades]KAG7094397.1 hypothetical protein E1B28_007997 [Marasmius oreades]